MGARIQSLPEGVKKSSAWPYATMPEKKTPAKKSGGWVLAISIDPDLNGLVTYYPAGTDFEVPQEERTSKRQTLHIDNGTWNGKKITTKPFYRVGSKEDAEKFASAFCTEGRGPKSPKLLPYSDGEFWGFNWCSLTEATVAIASQVADHFFNDRYEGAWLVGKAFGDQIHAAENAEYDKQRKAA